MTNEIPPSIDLREAHRNARHIVIKGVPWLVYELPPQVFDRRNTPSLVFESAMAIRRVRSFPADWRSLGDEELFALSWSA